MIDGQVARAAVTAAVGAAPAVAAEQHPAHDVALDHRAQLHVRRHLQDHRQGDPQMLRAVHDLGILRDHLGMATDDQRHRALARDEGGWAHGGIEQQTADDTPPRVTRSVGAWQKASVIRRLRAPRAQLEVMPCPPDQLRRSRVASLPAANPNHQPASHPPRESARSARSWRRSPRSDPRSAIAPIVRSPGRPGRRPAQRRAPAAGRRRAARPPRPGAKAAAPSPG